jgi:acyl-coenzyme A thioesterase PaaI-like protein
MVIGIMGSEFDEATSVRRGTGGRYDARITPGWDIAGNANGGYLIALAARAMVAEVERPPLTLTAHYLAPGQPGPCTIDVDAIRVGRRMATASAKLEAQGRQVMALLGTFGDQPPAEAVAPPVVNAEPVDLPPIEECLPGGPPVVEPDTSGFGDRIRSVYHPDDVGFQMGSPTGKALVRGYFEFADHHRIDELGLLVAVDAFAPVSFNRPEFPISWAPTVELTVHIRGVPVPGPLRCSFSSRFLQHGMFEEDGEVWDADGNLVALSRQLALIPR